MGGFLPSSLIVCAGVLGLFAVLESRRGRSATIFPLVFTFVGALSIVPGLLFYSAAQFVIGPRLSDTVSRVAFIWTVNAPLEELTKYACFALAAASLKSLRRPLDGLLQGASTGVGFALVENVMYGASGGMELFWLRTALSLPGHVLYGALWGGYHGHEYHRGAAPTRRLWIPALALVPAVFAHALFNTLDLLNVPLGWALVSDGGVLALSWVLLLSLQASSEGYETSPRQGP